MNRYITVLSNYTDEYFIKIHNSLLNQYNPIYGFLFRKGDNNTEHLLIHIDLEPDEATYLSLLLSLKLVKNSNENITNDDLELFGSFDTVAYFSISDS